MNTINQLANNGIVWHINEDELSSRTITIIRIPGTEYPDELNKALAEDNYCVVSLTEVGELLVLVMAVHE